MGQELLSRRAGLAATICVSLAIVGLACGSAPPRPAALAASASSSAEPSRVRDAELEYRFRHVVREHDAVLAVELCFEGSKTGISELRLPDELSDEERRDHIVGLRAMSDGAAITTTGNTATVSVTHPPGARVCVSYEVTPAAPDLDGLGGPSSTYRLVIGRTGFHVTGHAATLTPGGDDARPREVTLRWEGFQGSAAIANSFGVGREQHVRASVDALAHAIYVGGDFRLHELRVRDRPVWVAVYGQWRFSDDAFADVVLRVTAAERAFWKDDNFPHFLVTLLPLDDTGHYGGRGLTNSFMAYMSKDYDLGFDVKYLLAHELFHTWNGQRILRKEPERLVYWFSEGFTDYYARLLLLRARLITFDQYVRDYNEEMLFPYFASPVRTEPNTRILRDFDNDYAVEKLPYQRGAILAHNWNARIRERSGGTHSLDDPMQDLLREAVHRGTVVSAESVDAQVRPYLAEGVAGEIRSVVDEGKLLAPSPDALGPCVRLVGIKRAPVERGFDRRASLAAGVITGLKKPSNAERAGLRDGQTLLGLEVAIDATRQTRVGVRDGGKERVVAYLPAGPIVEAPRYDIDAKAYADDPARCLAWFGAAALDH